MNNHTIGDMVGIDAVIMGFVVIAAGTSVPDMVLSIISARKGNYDAAVSVSDSQVSTVILRQNLETLRIGVNHSKAETLVPMRDLRMIMLLLGAVILFSALLVSLFLTRRITRPIQTLIDANYAAHAITYSAAESRRRHGKCGFARESTANCCSCRKKAQETDDEGFAPPSFIQPAILKPR